MVYPLDEKSQEKFVSEYQINKHNNLNYNHIECISPTIKKRWKTFHTNIHYVQPSDLYKDHNDFKKHGSFNVYGSEKYINKVERACNEGNFIILKDDKNEDEHLYWAISKKEKLLFSVYDIE